jgi:hypothetical protein
MDSLVKRIEALEEKLKGENSSDSKSVGRTASVEDLIFDTGLDIKILQRKSLLLADPSKSKESPIHSSRQSIDSKNSSKGKNENRSSLSKSKRKVLKTDNLNDTKKSILSVLPSKKDKETKRKL